MTKFILGTKGEMEQTFLEGRRIPVTHIHTSPCYVVNIVKQDDSQMATIRLAFGNTKKNSKPVAGQLKKAGIKTPLRFLREFSIMTSGDVSIIEEGRKKGFKIGEQSFFVGDELKPPLLFAMGDKIQVTGTSKGKGFAGVVKRHRFAGGPRTHGQSDRERAPGSIGASTTPGRVMKGKRMAGRMGGGTITVKNLTVVEAGDGELVVKGLVPGAKGGLVIIKS